MLLGFVKSTVESPRSWPDPQSNAQAVHPRARQTILKIDLPVFIVKLPHPRSGTLCDYAWIRNPHGVGSNFCRSRGSIVLALSISTISHHDGRNVSSVSATGTSSGQQTIMAEPPSYQSGQKT
jgi:hypothetical protein